MDLITNRFVSPERAAREGAIRVRGGWMFRHPPKNLWRYSEAARRQAIRDWAKWGGVALTQAIGGALMGAPSLIGMAAVADGPYGMPGVLLSLAGGPTAGGTLTLDASGELGWTVYRVPRSGTIDRIGWFSGSATGSPTANVSAQGVSATDGLNDGTVLGAGNNAKLDGVTVTANAWHEHTLGETFAVTKGDFISGCVTYASGTSFQIRGTNNIPLNPNYSGDNIDGSNGKSASKHCIFFRYNDGTWVLNPYGFPTNSTTTTETMVTGTNNHRGNVWTNPSPKRMLGGIFLAPSTSIDFEAIVALDAWDGTADDDGTSNLWVQADKDRFLGLGSPHYWLSDQFLDVPAGNDCRSVLKATSASTITMNYLPVDSAGLLSMLEGGEALRWTQAHNPTGAGDWTDTTTKRAMTGFWFDKTDDGASAGGAMLRPVSMNGGLV